MKIVVFIFIVLSFLNARENPFKPLDDVNENSIKPTNIIKQYNNFSKKNIKPPNDARVLKYIKLGYQVLSGETIEKRINIDNKIDHHEKLVLITQSGLNTPSDEELVSVFKNDKIIIKTEPKHNDNTTIISTNESKIKFVPNKLPVKVSQISPKITAIKPVKIEKISTLKQTPKLNKLNNEFKFENFFTFKIEKNLLIINTSDELIRDFTTTKPRKIVLDFKRENSFYTKNIDINQVPFINVKIGSHENFYRASFLLDSPYLYEITKSNNQIILRLK